VATCTNPAQAWRSVEAAESAKTSLIPSGEPDITTRLPDASRDIVRESPVAVMTTTVSAFSSRETRPRITMAFEIGDAREMWACNLREVSSKRATWGGSGQDPVPRPTPWKV
jgi:hypothetical protein